MSIGSPGTYPADVSNKFGLYYDEDEDGTYNPVGSQQLTDYHYNSSSSIGYVSGSCWDRDPANSQGIFVGTCVITDNDNGSQARIEYDYHLVSVGKLTDYYDTGTSFVESKGALFNTHIAEEEWIQAGNRGSMHN